MTWTYTPDFSTDRDKIRFLIGDTDTTDQQLSDAEIAGALTMGGTYQQAAIVACGALASKYGRLADLSMGSFRVSMQQRADFYMKQKNQLSADSLMGPGGIGVPWVGGISIADMESAREDTDRVPSRNEMGMGEAPGVYPPTSPPSNQPLPWWNT